MRLCLCLVPKWTREGKWSRVADALAVKYSARRLRKWGIGLVEGTRKKNSGEKDFQRGGV